MRACDGWRVTRLVIALAALSTACASTPAAPTRVQCEQPARQEHRLAAEYVIATFDGGKLTYGDLSNGNSGAFRKLQNEYLKSLFTAERKAIDLFLAQKLVDRAAKTASTTPDAYLAKIAGESPQIDDGARHLRRDVPLVGALDPAGTVVARSFCQNHLLCP